MSFNSTMAAPFTDTVSRRPLITSYDLGLEHSQEHYLALQCMLEDADEQASSAQVPEPETVAS